MNVKTACLLALTLAACWSSAVDLVPLADDAALKPWLKKVNTVLSRRAEGSLAMEVRPGTFNFGWAQCPLPAGAVTPQTAGVYGRFRAAPSAPVTGSRST